MQEICIQILISYIHLDLGTHNLQKGHHVSFHSLIVDVYDILIRSDIDPTMKLKFSSNASTRPTLTIQNGILPNDFIHIPKTSYDDIVYPVDINNSSPSNNHLGYLHRTSSKHKPNLNNRRYLPNSTSVCLVCFGVFCKNTFQFCPFRGAAYLPTWVTKNAARYNALHKERSPESYIKQDINLRASTSSSYSKTYRSMKPTPKIN